MRARSAAAVRALLNQHASLYDAAAAVPGAEPVAGRGTAWRVTVGDETWLVRHYHRGGAVARLLRDRYAAAGGNRALKELHVSADARARGIPTPEVVAAVSYRDGLFCRFDIAVEYVDHARDLAQLLFEDRITNPEDVQRAATLITTMMRSGLKHADLNLKNLLVTPTDAYIIDLDRCMLVDRLSAGEIQRMRARFIRSLDKWESRTGRVVHDEHRRTLKAAFHG